ncbi:MAG: right-handed parallel beta-helix repeat-containing protein [Candidatus Zixiibacteriota bacterium]|nr:MAG: right-handed parallel beta-helix repeat-containing protein [candidate division Zixibacteria bacterium]
MAEIVVPDSVPNVQDGVGLLPDSGGTIFIRAGIHRVTEAIHVNRSNVTITGEQGTIIKLGDHVNQPVFLIGTDAPLPVDMARYIQNIRIAGLEIDGNRAAQDWEADSTRPGTNIMNNGIDIRKADNLQISDVNIHSARSGGLVASIDSRRIFISNACIYDNEFDGIALYSSEDVLVSDFICYENDFSGISFDNSVKNLAFDNGLLKNNGHNGIFARMCEDIVFNDLLVCGNQKNGCFLADHNGESGTGVKRLFFESCSFLESGEYGLCLISSGFESPNNTVIGCLFSGNTLGAILDGPGLLYKEGNIFQ